MDSAIIKYTCRLMDQNLQAVSLKRDYGLAIIEWNREKMRMIVRLQEIRRMSDAS